MARAGAGERHNFGKNSPAGLPATAFVQPLTGTPAADAAPHKKLVAGSAGSRGWGLNRSAAIEAACAAFAWRPPGLPDCHDPLPVEDRGNAIVRGASQQGTKATCEPAPFTRNIFKVVPSLFSLLRNAIPANFSFSHVRVLAENFAAIPPLPRPAARGAERGGATSGSTIAGSGRGKDRRRAWCRE